MPSEPPRSLRCASSSIVRKSLATRGAKERMTIRHETEHEIQEALERAGQGRTVIMIAHRLSTVQKANRILVLEKGTVVETGTHNELLKQNGRYLDLWTLQQSEQAA